LQLKSSGFDPSVEIPNTLDFRPIELRLIVRAITPVTPHRSTQLNSTSNAQTMQLIGVFNVTQPNITCSELLIGSEFTK
jgi:hypothetical protein